MRIFLDTNVLVSAFAARGLSADLFQSVLIGHEFVTGRSVLAELRKALRFKIKLSEAQCAELLDFVSFEAALIVEDAPPAECKADPGDRRVLGEALAGNAEVFVTGDTALLGLAALGKMRIATPRDLWDLLRKS